MNIALQKGWLDWCPWWAVALMLAIPVMTWAAIGLTHSTVRNYVRRTNRTVSIVMFIVIGALIGGSGGGVIYGLLRRFDPQETNKAKDSEHLTVSIKDFGYDDAKQQIETTVAFRNTDSVTRVIAAVHFFYRTKAQKEAGNNEMKIFMKGDQRRRLPFQVTDDPVYLVPGGTILKNYEAQIDPALFTEEGNVFGLVISTLNANGSTNVTTIELMELMGGLTQEGGLARAWTSKGVLSLDEPWHTVTVNMRGPSPAQKPTQP